MRLQELGHSALIEPMLRIEFHREPIGLPDPTAVLFTSRNAVRAIEGWPRAAAWHDRPSFAVGPQTAALARSAGFTDVRVGDRDAAALAALVGAVLAPGTGTILYPAARERSSDLEALLSQRGFRLCVVEAYFSATAPRLAEETVAALRNGRIDGVLAYSRRTAETFRDLLRGAGITDLPGIVLYALSDSVAAPLRDVGGAEIRVADQPDGEAMLALLPAGH